MFLRASVHEGQDEHGPLTIVEVGGQIIVGNRQELRRIIGDCIDKGSKRIDLVLSACTYVDSSGLGILHSLAKKAAASRHPNHDVGSAENGEVKWEFRVADPSSEIRNLLEMTKLDEVILVKFSAA